MRFVNSLYIHFPHCRHICNYCDFYKTLLQSNEDARDFQQYLDSSWEVHQKLLQENDFQFGPLETLYLGGGTPSLWGGSGAQYFAAYLKRHQLEYAEGVEFTLEVNPGAWTLEGLSAWEAVGVNRFSVGLQSLNANFLKILDRVHGLDDSFETLEFFKSNNKNYSVDLMLGLPNSEELGRDVLKELEEILDYRPSHISLYILTTADSYVHKDKLPSEEWVEKEYLQVSRFLQKYGMRHYEISNFAIPGKESRHNLKYWHSDSVAALGPSATGLLMAETQACRYKWMPHKSQFTQEILKPEQIKLERLYLGLRTFLGICPEEEFKASKEDQKAFVEVANKWSSQERGYWRDGRFVLNEKGYIILDSLMNELFLALKSL